MGVRTNSKLDGMSSDTRRYLPAPAGRLDPPAEEEKVAMERISGTVDTGRERYVLEKGDFKTYFVRDANEDAMPTLAIYDHRWASDV